MIWFWLRILDVFKPFFKWQGVDYEQLRSIVGIKLLMDNRRPFGLRGQQQKEGSSNFVFSMILGGLMGLVMGLLIANGLSVIISFTVYHSFLIVMIVMLLISDFSSVLLDTSDNTILLPRPVSSKTFYAARTTHILVYIGQMALSLSIIPIVVTFFTYGKIVGIASIATTAFSVIFAVALTNGLYLMIMRFTSEERLKNIINYFQIFMTLFVMGGYQIMPRLFSVAELKNTVVDFHWWALLVPPMWMSGLIKLVKDFSVGSIELALAVVAVCVPLAMWKVISKYLTPYFTSKLSDLGTGSAGVSVEAVPTVKRKSGFQIKEWLTLPGLERASYSLVWSALTYDRKLKLRIYPALGSILILIILPFLRSNNKVTSFQNFIHSMGESQWHLLIIYACIFALISISFELHFTDEYKAAWIYLSAPVKKPGVILSGALKALLAKFFIPIYAFATALILTIWGSRAISDLVFGALACIFVILLVGIIGEKRLPLSIAPTARNQTESFARAIISMIIIGALGAGHYALAQFSLLIWIACPVTLVCIIFTWKLYSNITWQDVVI